MLYYSGLIWSVATFLLPITARLFGVFGAIVVRVVAGVAQGKTKVRGREEFFLERFVHVTWRCCA